MTLPNLNNYSGLLATESIWGSSPQLIKRMINNDSGQILYIGWNSDPNALTSDASWSVAQLTYDDNSFLNTYNLPIPRGWGPFYIWDDVASYF